VVVDPGVRELEIHKICKGKSGVDPSHQCCEGHVVRDHHFSDSQLREFKGRVVRTQKVKTRKLI
jgi:hypothetical protein